MAFVMIFLFAFIIPVGIVLALAVIGGIIVSIGAIIAFISDIKDNYF